MTAGWKGVNVDCVVQVLRVHCVSWGGSYASRGTGSRRGVSPMSYPLSDLHVQGVPVCLSDGRTGETLMAVLDQRRVRVVTVTARTAGCRRLRLAGEGLRSLECVGQTHRPVSGRALETTPEHAEDQGLLEKATGGQLVCRGTTQRAAARKQVRIPYPAEPKEDEGPERRAGRASASEAGL